MRCSSINFLVASLPASHFLLFLRFCANCMIGKKVRVFWPVDSSWYTGVVLQHDPATGEHLLKYDDEDTEWVKVCYVEFSVNGTCSRDT